MLTAFFIVERERKKAEKQAKFDQKKAKTTPSTATSSKTQEKKAKAEKKAEEEKLPPWVEETPAGDKKSTSWFSPHPCLLLTQYSS